MSADHEKEPDWGPDTVCLPRKLVQDMLAFAWLIQLRAQGPGSLFDDSILFTDLVRQSKGLIAELEIAATGTTDDGPISNHRG